MSNANREPLGPSRAHLGGLRPLINYSVAAPAELDCPFTINPLASPVARFVQAPFLVAENRTHADIDIGSISRRPDPPDARLSPWLADDHADRAARPIKLDGFGLPCVVPHRELQRITLCHAKGHYGWGVTNWPPARPRSRVVGRRRQSAPRHSCSANSPHQGSSAGGPASARLDAFNRIATTSPTLSAARASRPASPTQARAGGPRPRPDSREYPANCRP
jgi:hypothetical protein